MATPSIHNKKHAKSQAAASKMPSQGELFLVATPIGNLGDITLRALETLKSADTIACEDTRTSGFLLKHYAISVPLVPLHAHNEAGASERIIEKMKGGENVALISDAGTPLISDPGARLVKAAIEAGIRVTPIPGASALLSALTVAGLPTDTFFFAGFLPGKSTERKELLLWLKTIPTTLVFYEAPHRLTETLAALGAALGDRSAAVARELTKLHEECKRNNLSALTAYYTATPPKGECVIVVEGTKAMAVSDAEIDAALREKLQTGSLREAVDVVTEHSRWARSDVYARALALKKEQA